MLMIEQESSLRYANQLMGDDITISNEPRLEIVSICFSDES